MNKSILNAVAAAVLAAGAGTAVAADAANTYEIFMPGATSVKKFVKSLFANTALPKLCATAPTVVSSTNEDVYTCNGNPANVALAPYFGTGNITGTTSPKKTKIVFHKVNNDPKLASGSIIGVYPLTRADSDACSKVNGHTGDVGVSDLAPATFVGANVPASTSPCLKNPNFAALAPSVGPTQIFGLVVNKVFSDAIRKTAARPNLTTAQGKSLLTGVYPAGLPALPAGKTVTFCSRNAGSGTRAAAGKFFGVTQTTKSTAAVAFTGNAGQGDMEKCLATANSAGKWAFGYASTDNNVNDTLPYVFVQLNGKDPTLVNAKAGTYGFKFPLSFQSNKTHKFDAIPAYDKAKKAIIGELIKETRLPAVVTKLNADAKHTWGQAGFLP